MVAARDTTDLLAHLVAFDTTSGRSNLDLVAFIRSVLDEHGLASTQILSEDGTRANLLARIGPAVEGGVVLSGHLDCVPVEGQPWSGPPFGLVRDGDRLYGRGTADMKGFVAAVLAAVPRFVGRDLARPVVLAFSYDEETGTIGAPSLVERLVSDEPCPAAVIVGEPTGMEVATAHKGVRFVRVTVEGVDAHSSQPHLGANAISAATRLAVFIDELATHHRAAAADPSFDPPYTTFNLGRISGGQAVNIVAPHCELEWEFRPVPLDDSDEIVSTVRRFAEDSVVPELREVGFDVRITLEETATVRALAPQAADPAACLARQLAGFGEPDRSIAFGTDGGHFQAAGLSTAVCGPGSIDQAHRPDEFIEVEQLRECARFLERLGDHLSAPRKR